MRHADHRNTNTYGGYYQNAISTVDGQATYLGLEKKLDGLHELFRGFSIRRDFHYQPEVTLQVRKEMNDCVPLMENAANELQEREVQRGRQRVHDRRRQQKNRLLNEERTHRRPTQALGAATYRYESDFQRSRRLMPERHRLAESLFQTRTVRNEPGVAVMNDLVALYSSRNEDTYCASLNGSRTHCVTCGVARFNGLRLQLRSHVYHCRKQHDQRRGGFSEFCFACFSWVEDVRQWEEHVQQHCTDPPLKCNLVIFRETVLRPGLCPDCMGGSSAEDAGSIKFVQYLNMTRWIAHTSAHVRMMTSNDLRCLHPHCRDMPLFSNMKQYLTHRSDVHQIHPPSSLNAERRNTFHRFSRQYSIRGDVRDELTDNIVAQTVRWREGHAQGAERGARSVGEG